ncbi:MAG: bifunctional transaldolase/phosoglucose isomerase [Acidobacteria bacterium]|nr:bifunctional transaldolase/phosoglucose isomerase [Acidobacteriota bacterium]MBV9475692.1 bifunctional transaldolase/phosoglucose isomerase [Acidobacteriota bacterium]
MTNPLAELPKLGQSVWYDQMERKLVSSGELQRMIDEDDLRGLTSNPTIFEKAISGSEDYDGQLRMLASQGMSRDDIYDEIVIEDIGNAADVFLPVYRKTNGDDGYVSLEVSPLFARDTAKTVAEAKRLFVKLGRDNAMIKIPATPEGIPAIEQAIATGINVNVTLIFSIDVYAQVIEAYLRGLERRASQSLPIGNIASVASFFVSRIDAQADKQLDAKMKDDPSLAELKGKVAIANAKVAYQLFKEQFSSSRFEKLRALGARVQRPLWASTGTKDPKYSDVLYIESLIGADTVNTIPPATFNAFRDHGRVQPTLEADLDDAKRVLATFEAKGFSLKAITDKLTDDGVKAFDESFAQLTDTIEARRDAVVRGLPERLTLHNVPSLDEFIARAEKDKVVSRIWAKDATLWKSDDEHKKIIENALGWLVVMNQMKRNAKGLVELTDEYRRGMEYVVVLGMGGSSLVSEVTRRVFPKREGYPELLVLDSTAPDAIAQLEAHIDLAKTLFIVASKSGSTTEPRMFHRYFYERMKSVAGERAGMHFIAITDPGSQLIEEAKRDRFRSTFLNLPDIGGRYSALSFFGLVPMALAGVDVDTLLDRAQHAAHVSSLPQIRKNPAALLGVVLGAMAQQGRNKLTLITPRPLDTLGLWVEQLIAESTGKEGKGIVPIAGEPDLPANAYGNDRLFVCVRMRGSDETARLRELAAAGHPVVDLVLEDALDLGETFFVWEFATAVAGTILGVDTFDQPNVQESKDNTKRILGEIAGGAQSSQPVEVRRAGDDDALAALLAQVKPGDYFAITEYFAETPERDAAIARIREAIARELHVATTTGYGPRFLHSTGQLHKGGPETGVFLQLVASARDIDIPGENLTFSQLVGAQALGDAQSLATRHRRLLRLDLGNDIDANLAWLEKSVTQALARNANGARVKA